MRRRLLELAPWLVLAAVWAAFLVGRHGGLYLASDDSYIYLGYVKRALTAPRELFSYNAGEHSAGITGVLYYYVLLGVCALVHGLAPETSSETALRVGAALTNVGLLGVAAHLYLRCWRRLDILAPRDGALSLSLAFLLFCAQPKWLWAVFAGMEGPLAACGVLLAVDRFQVRAPAWQASLVAALLVATRPETILVAWALPALAVLRRGPHARLRRFGAAYAVAGIALALLVLPCLALTGRVLPSSMGTRVQVLAFVDPGALWRYLERLLQTPAYWRSEWWWLAGLLLAGGLVSGVREGRWAVAGWFGLVTSFLVLRVVTGIAAFNVEDRYVSYLWPLYALGIAACAAALARAFGGRRLVPPRIAVALAAAVLFVVTAALPVRDFLDRTDRHVAAMGEIVLTPARYMASQLPADARICMEPAGALRVFTDFYLVDAIGLTTTHAQTNQGNYADFLHDHRVGWVFDRPARIGEALLVAGTVRDRRAWARERGVWGDVHLYEFAPPATLSLTGVSHQPAVPGRPRAVFDNNRLARWDALLGGGSGFLRGRAPDTVTAELAQSAEVDALVLALSAPSGRMPREFRVELRQAGRWASAEIASAELSSRVATHEVWTLTLARPRLIDGVRLVREPVGAASVVDELTLLRDGRPYTWLWDF